MATKTITICDGCNKELKETKEKYYIDFNTKTFLDGAGDTDYNEIDLVFCETCVRNIKNTLSRIADGMKPMSKPIVKKESKIPNTDVIFNKIVPMIVELLQIDEEEITYESSFINDLGADSLDMVELAMVIEEEYDIEIPDREAENIDTVDDLVHYIWSNTTI